MLKVAALAVLVSAAIASAELSAAQPVTSGDFDGDGNADLAIGVALEDIGAVADAGAVHVLYGTATGLSAANDDFWHQDSAGLLDAAEAGDNFGTSLAAGDFNADGYDDLAIGVPEQEVSGFAFTGAVAVLYGSSTGLTDVGDQVWDQDVAGIEDDAAFGDDFGRALAAGDFNGDQYDDLAIGAPFDDPGAIADAGGVNVLFGSSTGLTEVDDQFWNQDVAGIRDAAEADDRFGLALASGNFDGDAYVDLAIAAAEEDQPGINAAGAVHVLYGSATGPSDVGDDFWHQDSPGILNAAEAEDKFGGALVAGDFNDDGYDDLGVGIQEEDHGGFGDAGAVAVLYGASTGLSATGNQFWNKGTPGVLGNLAIDLFGCALASGDFDVDGIDDLAIGASNHQPGAFVTGQVHILLGSAGGLTATGDELWDQDSLGVRDATEAVDRFGSALASGDFDGDGLADLAIAVPYEDVGAITDAGAVNVLYNNGSGLSGANDDFWNQDSAGILNTSEADDRMGGT